MNTQARNTAERAAGSIAVTPEGFLLNGAPFQIRSGELHFTRIPRPYWRHRLEMARAMGLNTVCAYLFWNVHEPRRGEFVFTGSADVRAFVRLADDVGLKVILRPGPYACAEWDFGGLPSWLLSDPGIRLRCSDPRFVDAARHYLLRVGEELAPLQVTNGGPIILVQVENEYGSYGSDRNYLASIRDALRDAGFDTPLFTCDGPGAFERGTVAGAFPVVNFNDDPTKNLAILKAFDPEAPAACGEYYPGWFDHWGKPHHTRSAEQMMPEVETMLDKAAMFSIYMFHGGTSFGFTAGANADRNGAYFPQTTSYDYDAPLDEAGRPTEKYHRLRELFARRAVTEQALPEPPAPYPVIAIPPIVFSASAGLFDHLPKPIFDIQPRSMECYSQGHGLILYSSTLPKGKAGPLTIRDLHDYGTVFLDGVKLGVLDRRLGENRIEIPTREQDAALDILVEAMGRVNYGPYLADRKGITERVEFPVPYEAGVVMNWDVYPLPLDRDYLHSLRFAKRSVAGPAFHQAAFDLNEVGDTFLDLRGWGKGYVWVNGRNLGRYWNIGPQQTLYLPGCYLRTGTNEIIVFDFESAPPDPVVAGLTEPILNEMPPAW